MLVEQAIKFCRNAIRGLLRARKSRKHDVSCQNACSFSNIPIRMNGVVKSRKSSTINELYAESSKTMCLLQCKSNFFLYMLDK